MHNPHFRRPLLSVAGLLTACVLGLAPAGCGDSSTAGADKRVHQATDEAARIAGSAGEYRPNDTFTTKVRDAGWQTEQQTALGNSIKPPAKSASEDPTEYAQKVEKIVAGYLKKNTVDQDLNAALKKLNDAFDGDAPGNGALSVAQAEIGGVANQIASEQLDQASSAVLDLVRKSVHIQALGTEIAEIGAQAGLGDATKDAYATALNETVNKSFAAAKSDADAAAADLKTKTDLVTTLQSQMDQKRKEGQEARVQAAEFLGKSDQAKGDDVLTLYGQSAQFQDTAAAALAAASAMQPALDVATVEQRIAETKAKSTTAALQDVTDLKTDMEKTVAGAAASADSSRQAAQKLLDDKTTGFNTAVTDFNTSADSALAMLGKVSTQAKSTTANYQKAQQALEKYRSEIMEQKRGIKDPVLTGVSNKQLDRVLDLSSAAALNRSAQAHLLAASVAQMKDQVAAVKADPGRQAAAGGAAMAAERRLALDDFNAAAKIARGMTNSPDMKGTPIVWLSNMVLAISEEGASLASTGAEVKTHHDAARNAAADAQALNAMLVIQSTAAIK